MSVLISNTHLGVRRRADPSGKDAHGTPIPAGATAFYDYATRATTCHAIECADADGLTREQWQGAPTSGAWVKVVAAQRLGPGAPMPERTWKERYGRCEDAPCCGCCS